MPFNVLTQVAFHSAFDISSTGSHSDMQLASVGAPPPGLVVRLDPPLSVLTGSGGANVDGDDCVIAAGAGGAAASNGGGVTDVPVTFVDEFCWANALAHDVAPHAECEDDVDLLEEVAVVLTALTVPRPEPRASAGCEIIAIEATIMKALKTSRLKAVMTLT